ncbi:MAG: hypothetical protein HY843_01560 [Bdellovibrio sp.]|nr:hypothetical protein [Bdellovibrio sp.]
MRWDFKKTCLLFIILITICFTAVATADDDTKNAIEKAKQKFKEKILVYKKLLDSKNISNKTNDFIITEHEKDFYFIDKVDGKNEIIFVDGQINDPILSAVAHKTIDLTPPLHISLPYIEQDKKDFYLNKDFKLFDPKDNVQANGTLSVQSYSFCKKKKVEIINKARDEFIKKNPSELKFIDSQLNRISERIKKFSQVTNKTVQSDTIISDFKQLETHNQQIKNKCAGSDFNDCLVDIKNFYQAEGPNQTIDDIDIYNIRIFEDNVKIDKKYFISPGGKTIYNLHKKDARRVTTLKDKLNKELSYEMLTVDENKKDYNYYKKRIYDMLQPVFRDIDTLGKAALELLKDNNELKNAQLDWCEPTFFKVEDFSTANVFLDRAIARLTINIPVPVDVKKDTNEKQTTEKAETK